MHTRTALFPLAILAAPALHAQDAASVPPIPTLGVAMVGDVRPAVALGLLWVKTLAGAPPPPSEEGPAPIVAPHWFLRAHISGGVTFARRRGREAGDTDAGPAPTALASFALLHDASIPFFNRIGVSALGSVNPHAVGPALELEASGRVLRFQVGPVRMLREHAWRAAGMLDVSLPFLVCDILERC